MSVFVDTSALYALLDEDDRNHSRAADIWGSLLSTEPLITHTYVTVETTALVQHRLGKRAAVQLHEGLLPPIRLVVVDHPLHHRSVEHWKRAAGTVSFVDATSFMTMEQEGLNRAFAFDDDFARAGVMTL